MGKPSDLVASGTCRALTMPRCQECTVVSAKRNLAALAVVLRVFLLCAGKLRARRAPSKHAKLATTKHKTTSKWLGDLDGHGATTVEVSPRRPVGSRRPSQLQRRSRTRNTKRGHAPSPKRPLSGASRTTSRLAPAVGERLGRPPKDDPESKRQRDIQTSDLSHTHTHTIMSLPPPASRRLTTESTHTHKHATTTPSATEARAAICRAAWHP